MFAKAPREDTEFGDGSDTAEGSSRKKKTSDNAQKNSGCKLLASLCVRNALTIIPPFRYTYYYDYKICCPHFFNRLWQPLGCARSITQPGRVARCVALTGGESRIAFTRRVASGFAQGNTHSKEGQAEADTASGRKPIAGSARDRRSGQPARARRGPRPSVG
jgi:hypothetical protein